MVDSEYSTEIYKPSKISIGTVIKNLEMSKLVKTVKKLPFVISYVPDQYKTQKTCDKAILENGGTLESVPDCCKNQEMCNKAVGKYLHALKFVPNCYITQINCDKAVNTNPSTV